jgi:hypothetical protein
MTTLLVGIAASGVAQSLPEPYSLLLRDDGRWCAYKDSEEFKSEAANLKPTETARVTYLSGKLIELTYQIEAESGDWIVVDKYTPSNADVVLRRANLMAQENLQVIQETQIHGAMADPFHIVSVATLDGKKAELPPNVDFPAVPIRTNLLAAPFVKVVSEMRSRSLGRLCQKVE